METNNNVLIKVTDLKKHFNKGEIKALDGVSLDICKGDVIVIIGPSGCGKSTFLKVLNRMNDPELVPGLRIEGEALYRGMAKEGRCRFLESYSVASMARQIGSIWRKLDEKKC